MGTPEFAVPSMRAVAGGRHAILAVITRPDRPRRSASSAPAPSPVKAAAAELGLPILQPASVRDPGFLGALEALAPEVILVVAFGQILPPEILAIPPQWCINLHASLLPKYRGAAPIARAIMAGETVTGLTTMKMDRGLDTGDILLQEDCAIEAKETAGELTSRLAAAGAGLVLRTLETHSRGEIRPRPQDTSAATLAPPLTPADGRIDWRSTASEIARRILGCNPWPVGRATFKGGAVQILRAWPAEGPDPAVEPSEPGRVVDAIGDRVVVQCGEDTRLALLEVRFPGRRAMSALEAVNGRM